MDSALTIAKKLCSYDTNDISTTKWEQANEQAKNYLLSFADKTLDAVDYFDGVYADSFTTLEDDNGYLVLVISGASTKLTSDQSGLKYNINDLIYINGTLYNKPARITNISGDNITTNLLYTENAAVAASLTTAFPTANSNLTFTAVSTGVGGNSITVQYYSDATPFTPLSVQILGNDITIIPETDADGTIISTANQVLAALELNAEIIALVGITLKSGEDGSGIVSTMVQTNLSGGAAAYGDSGTAFPYGYYKFVLAEAWLTIYSLVRTCQQILNNKVLASSNAFGEGVITQAGMQTKKDYQIECLNYARNYFEMGSSELV